MIGLSTGYIPTTPVPSTPVGLRVQKFANRVVTTEDVEDLGTTLANEGNQYTYEHQSDCFIEHDEQGFRIAKKSLF